MKTYLIILLSVTFLFSCEDQEDSASLFDAGIMQEKDSTPPNSDNLPIQVIDFDTIDIYPEDYNVPDMD